MKWLDDLFDALNLDNINLVGMSYGGWQASQYVLKHQKRINKVILLAPAATVMPISSTVGIKGFLSMLPLKYFTKSLLYWLMEDAVKKDEQSMKNTADFMFLASQSFKTRRPPNPTVLNDEEWKSIQIPTLYLIGENEKTYSASKALQRLSSVAPQIKTDLIPNAGHDLVSVQNKLINKKILEFLKINDV